MSNDANQSLLGRTLGDRYVVDRLLGTGATGTVYCARRIGLGSMVAIKVLHPQLVADRELVQRFEREAFSTSQLDHPNALRALDFGEDGDLRYLVTEYVEAENLLTIMQAQWPLGDQRVVAILSQVLGALIAVHDIGIVHRDIKPENILVLAGKNDDGAKADIVKVCDFGIAQFAQQTLRDPRSFAPRITAGGMAIGTPDYMSPEQARGHSVDGRSDLYSVGVVLYHLLTGQTPFNADTPLGIALQQVTDAPVPPSHCLNVHPALEAICLRALSKQPDDRFQTASDMRKALRNALTIRSMAHAPVSPLVESPPVNSLRVASIFSTSSPAMLGYAAAVSVLAVTAAFVSSRCSSATDPIEIADRVHASPAPGSLPELAAALTPSLTSDTTREAKPTTAIGERPKALAAPRRFAARGRQQPEPAADSVARSWLVAASLSASPVSSASPASTSASPASTGATLRVRSVPSSSKPDVPAPPLRRQAVPPVSLDTGRASLGIAGVVASGGISGAKVKIGLSHVPLLACYQQTFRSRPAAPLESELRLTIDLSGRVVSASLSRDGDLAGFRSCVESAARSALIRGVDTGDGSATVQLKFSPR